MNTPSVELQNVSLIFGDGDPRNENVVAVDNTSLEIPAGQFVAIVGPSGSVSYTHLTLPTNREV